METLFNNMRIKIHQAKYATVDSSWSKKVFPYPHHRIYYITEGEAVLKLNHSEIILTKDNIYLLPAFSMVEAICRNTLSKYYIHFQTVPSVSSNIFELCPPKIAVKADENSRYLFEHIIKNCDTDSIYSDLVMRGSIQLILAPFFKDITMANDKAQKFSPVLDYIENNLNRKMSIEELAKIVNLDKVYFSNLFSKVYQLSPLQYIINKRLEKAQLLLVNSQKKVREIALDVGFENEMYFSRLFSSKLGMTPGMYRKISQTTI